MKITIEEIVSQRPNGDRDTQRHPSSAFKVILTNGSKRSVLFKNDQYDSWYCHIDGTRAEYLGEAQKKALEFADILSCEIETKIDEDASRIKELKDSIERAQEEINDLQMKRLWVQRSALTTQAQEKLPCHISALS